MHGVLLLYYSGHEHLVTLFLFQIQPPPRDTWNSDSVKYQFLVHPKGQDQKKISPDQYRVLTDNIATVYRASGLQMYTLYNVTMRMFNDKGQGPWSNSIFYRTSEDCEFELFTLLLLLLLFMCCMLLLLLYVCCHLCCLHYYS